MKVLVYLFVIAVFVFVECNHTFMGSNVFRPLLFHRNVRYTSNLWRKRVENFTYTIPSTSYPYYRPTIQGILAYDLTNSSATANVTQGGIGFQFVTLRMKSDKNREINYDIYIYG
ncbi:uncharacterized protein LOC111003188 [Pieris rapae]|uniref:uncharacterized protein LOC111003188 n=1 Tax=Pieris rapae TaxID=64459 RepID=UPI001E27BEE6|nr:uncharacterized protein LOC111003188 [Pieris rapae]